VNLLLLFEADRVASASSQDPVASRQNPVASSQDRFVVSDRRYVHLVEVLKAIVGQQIRVGLWDGPKGLATLTRLTDTHAEMDVAWLEPAPEPPAVHLILAIPRPKSFKKLLPQIVALGVRRLTLLRSWRVAQPYLSSPLLQPEQHRSLIADGLMQAGCTRPPIVEMAPRFKPFVEDVAARLPSFKWIAHPAARTPLGTLRPAKASITLAIGPEGCWLPYEVQAFEAAGLQAVMMGRRILRVETACVALLANIELLRTLDTPAPDHAGAND